MNIAIYFFSGTGNTAYIAKHLQAGFIAHNCGCELIPIENITLNKQPIEPQNYDLIGIGYPVHAFDAPRIVFDFVNLLPSTPQHYFLFKTAGDSFLFGGSSRNLRLKLAGKGWRLSHESFFHMPANVTSSAKPDKIKRLTDAARQQTEYVTAEICSGIRKTLPDTGAQRLGSLIHKLEDKGCHRASKNWLVNQNCTLCGLCVKQCPTNNITISEERLVFDDSCILCIRCWWHCPTRALYHRHLNRFLLKKPYLLT
jgi:ferredoxin/flavodoxin